MSPLTEAHSGSAVSRDLADFHPKRDTRPHAQRSGVDDSSRRRNMRKTEDFPYYAYTIRLLILPVRTENPRVEALWREKKATRLAIRRSRYENASVFVGFGVGFGPDQRAPVWRGPDGGAQLTAYLHPPTSVAQRINQSAVNARPHQLADFELGYGIRRFTSSKKFSNTVTWKFPDPCSRLFG